MWLWGQSEQIPWFPTYERGVEVNPDKCRAIINMGVPQISIWYETDWLVGLPFSFPLKGRRQRFPIFPVSVAE